MPPQHIPENEWTEDKYRECVQAVLYDHINYSYANGPVNYYKQICENIQLYFGNQSGNEWEALRQVLPNQKGTNALHVKGKEAHSIMDFHIGSMKGFISNLDKSITTRSIYHGRTSEREIQRDILNLQIKTEELAKTINEVGYRFKSIPPNIQIKTQQEQQKFLETNFKEDNEILAYYICQKAMQDNRFEYIFGMQAAYAIITGIAGVKISNTDKSVIPTWRNIPSPNIIKDRRVDDDYGLYDEFVGEISWMPVDWVINEYNLSEDEGRRLREASKVGASTAINSLWGFDMFWQNNQIGMCSIVEVYWNSYKDSRIKGANRKNSFGNYDVKMLPSDTKSKPQPNNARWVETQRTATLLGNDIVKRYGEVTNLAVNHGSQFNKPPFPILTVLPQMMFGQSHSMGDDLAGLQAQFDKYMYKLEQAMSRDYGKQLFYDPSSDSGEGSLLKMLVNMKTSGINEIPRNDGDGKMSLPVDMLDFSMSPSTSFYLTLCQDTLQRMRLATNTNELLQGTQSTITGKGVQENTQQANNQANQVWMQPVLGHLGNILQVTADRTRINIAAKNITEMDIDVGILLGVGDLRTIKTTPKMLFEQVGIYPKFEGVLDKQSRQNIIAYLTPAIQNGKLDASVLIKIDQAATLTEAENIAELAIKQMHEREDAQMKAQMEASAMMADQKSADSRYVAESQERMADNAGNKKIEGDKIKAEAELMNTAMKHAHEATSGKD